MHVTVKASLILVGLVALLSILVLATPLRSNFILSHLVFLGGAIAVNLAVVFWEDHRHQKPRHEDDQGAAQNADDGGVLVPGGYGTFGTSLVAGALFALFLRGK